MITIPLYISLFIYIIFLAIFAIFAIINVYHIIASASFTLASFFMSFLVFSLTILTLYFTANLLVGIDWKTPITVLNAQWFYSVF
jgi:hypothetical protein